jgi:putative component of membrane protein insertase Oxa1/YidC/SpoIIIJ protein YidD
MKIETRLVMQAYQFFRALRYNLLKSGFGVVSHCKHTPTCGTYFIKQIEKNGVIVGLFKGIPRVLWCW